MPDREGAQQLKKNCSNKLHVVPIDVTDDWQVRGAVKYVKEHIGDNGNISGMNLCFHEVRLKKCPILTSQSSYIRRSSKQTVN